MKKNNKQLTKAQIITKFEEFLKENNCYEEFVKNTLTLNKGHWKTMQDYYNNITLYEYFLCSAFIFTNLKNADFWRELYTKWKSRYKELISE